MSDRGVLRVRSRFSAVLPLALAAMLVVACGGRSDAPAPSSEADASTSEASADGSGEVLPPGVAYKSGGVNCCAKGIGRDCCTPGVACGEYGGGLGECLPAGAGINAKDTCTFCCDAGAKNNILRMNVVDGKCVSGATSFDDHWICAACGDGVCNAAAHENVCNCPEDCH